MFLAIALLAPVLSIGAATTDSAANATAPRAAPADASQRCNSLAEDMRGRWPDPTTQVLTVQLVPTGTLSVRTMAGALSIAVPEHCELIARLQQRPGVLGQTFALRLHLRLPLQWNGRFYFQGGGGSNGELGDALGQYSPAAPPALVQGFAVVSQDSGHDNQVNNEPDHSGTLVFGFDPEARRNYGHASLPLATDAARAAVQVFYGRAPNYSYFVGCSKGGEEALAVTQRYADRFDGVLAGAPAMSLPRAAVAGAWDTQAFASAVAPSTSSPLHVADLNHAFSDAELALVRAAVLGACDTGDGLQDGIVSDFSACTTARVKPALRRLQCAAARNAGCLHEAQVHALLRVMAGAHDVHGRSLYSDWAWDAGIAAPGWRLWKIGGSSGRPPSRTVMLGGASLASVFTTPPTPLPADPEALLRFLLQFDIDRDAAKIYATTADFTHSAWDDISARSSDLDAFRARKGKLIIYHGVADPVFSINDTATWWREVNQRYYGKAASFVRLYAVPGMNHCGGGEATDRFDALAALMQWTEQDRAPERIVAQAGAGTPWPGRERPLCAYPQSAHYLGHGDPEKAENFVCR